MRDVVQHGGEGKVEEEDSGGRFVCTSTSTSKGKWVVRREKGKGKRGGGGGMDSQVADSSGIQDHQRCGACHKTATLL